MADPTFFELFKATWAQNGLAEGITEVQYKTGWAYIGSVPPSVEQFNKVQQTTDERLGWIYNQLDALAAVTGRPLLATSSDALSFAFQNLNAANLKAGTVPVARLSGVATGLTAGAAQKLETARAIGVSGDATGYGTFDGTGNLSFPVTLTATGVAEGIYGTKDYIPTFAVDAKGRVVGANAVPVGNAATATRLATGRSFSLSGGATAAGVSFDGSNNVNLVVTELDVSKAAAGVLSVARGGTGLAIATAGAYVRGNGSGFSLLTGADVMSDLGAAPLNSPQFTGTPGAPTAAPGTDSAQVATTAFVVRHTAKSIPWITLANLPATDKGPVFVVERREIWVWVETTYYVGYRSPYCGRLEFGHTASPLPGQIDANGQWVTTASYSSLQAYAKENSLMVSVENWAPGAYVFAETGTGLRLPDLRNQFVRFTGSDVDGNTRYLASSQRDALQRIHGGIEKVQIAAGGSATSGALSLSPWNEYGQYLTSTELGQRVANLALDSEAVARTSSETRPTNVALHPRIHF
ncbi:hypothetical protein IPU70_08135 [Achromobacter sp. SD115]|uniref:hypothetical protein n=1 Tax=Achromobacter sp. SD115 TaxID=2782011 RepID=UPI001A9744F0|nr:hypothetical protein [Achromobacter sp. SD115]MBO1013513.1 hypothetical protein [Achromobacter sp. SD115]